MLKETPYSMMKIFHHHDMLHKLEKKQRCTPLYIRIKPTNQCNHDCYYCHYKNAYLTLDEYKKEDFIPKDKMMEIIADISKMEVKAVTFSGGGEPLLYPYIEESLEKMIAAHIDVSIITNGSQLKGRKADLLTKAKWVRISIDSVKDENYCKIRGIQSGEFTKLCNNIREFAKIKEVSCELGINFVVGKENYKEISEIAFLMKELGANHVKFAPLINNATEEYHAPFKDQVIAELAQMKELLNSDTFQIIDLYTSDFDNYEVFKRTYKSCPIKEFICVIGANSKVYYCHDKAYLSNGLVCDLNKTSFKEGWFSKETDKLFQEFNAVECCKQHCVYDRRNTLINSYLEMDQNHINFV